MRVAMLRPCVFQSLSRTTTSTPLLRCTARSWDVTFEGSSANREAESHFFGKIYVSSPDPSLADYIAAEIKTDQLKSAFADIFRNTIPSRSFYSGTAGPRGIYHQRGKGAFGTYDAGDGTFEPDRTASAIGAIQLQIWSNSPSTSSSSPGRVMAFQVESS
jgi:hypothetical protein